MLQFFIAKTRS